MWTLSGRRGYGPARPVSGLRADIQKQERPGAHDWTNLLGRLGMLDYGHALGTFTNFTAMLVMVVALMWAAYLLCLQYQNLDRQF